MFFRKKKSTSAYQQSPFPFFAMCPPDICNNIHTLVEQPFLHREKGFIFTRPPKPLSHRIPNTKYHTGYLWAHTASHIPLSNRHISFFAPLAVAGIVLTAPEMIFLHSILSFWLDDMMRDTAFPEGRIIHTGLMAMGDHKCVYTIQIKAMWRSKNMPPHCFL